MDYIDSKQMLSQLLELDTVMVYPGFVTEFEECISNSGEEYKMMTQLVTRITMVQKNRPEILCKQKGFEHLKGYHNLYSMKLNSNSFNLRVLFSYNNKDKLILISFFEKEGKKATGYKKYADLALERRREMIGK